MRILLLDFVEKSLGLIVLMTLKIVGGFQDGIELPELVFWIGEGIGKALLERLGGNGGTKSEVAESAQFVLCVRTEISSARSLTGKRIVGQKGAQLFLKHGDGGGLLGGNVVGFSGIRFQIVQFRLGRFDKVKPLTLERVQRTPSKRTEGIKGFAIRRIVCGLCPGVILVRRRA